MNFIPFSDLFYILRHYLGLPHLPKAKVQFPSWIDSYTANEKLLNPPKVICDIYRSCFFCFLFVRKNPENMKFFKVICLLICLSFIVREPVLTDSQDLWYLNFSEQNSTTTTPSLQ